MAPNLDWLCGPDDSPHITPFQRLLRERNWAATALGPIETWCRELRSTIRFMAVESNPVIVYWGPTHAIIYNEAHIPLVGNRHPEMLGRNAADEFPVFWHFFASILEEQSRTGKPHSGEASKLLMERHGFLEETYFDWKLVPIIGDDGAMLGGYGTPTDRTKDIISERRNHCVRKLSERVATASSFEDLWRSAILGLSENDKDVPFALLYANEGLSKRLTSTSKYDVVGSLAVPASHKLLQRSIDLEANDTGFAPTIRKAVQSKRPISVLADDPNIRDHVTGIKWRGSDTPCSQFVVMPIMAGTEIALALVMGINPYRTYNTLYTDFVRTISDVLASNVSKLKLSEEIKHSAELASKATLDFKRSEMRFSRFASRTSSGLVVADLEGQVRLLQGQMLSLTALDPLLESGLGDFFWRRTRRC